ncbi:MAG TPA: tRNA uridine-5-carboxymethylaminomethyl(34) synthesis GTPase MnmE [Candidatus Koribacter sp.]
MNLDDTIVAIATPPGRGGIGVVRLAGPEARAVAQSMLKAPEFNPQHAHFTELIDPESGDRLDEVVVTYFAKPHSYTTDDIIELSCHGSPVLLARIVELCLARGLRLADPGEFTMRAFLNGRIDLTQAEAVRDLIDSQTLYQAKIAAQQLGGSVSRRIQPIKQELVNLIAVLEAGIDFAEDDVSVLPAEQAIARIAGIRAPLAKLQEGFAFGKVVHEGLTLAIVGRPNVGKSSLFNQLVERDRAIVTAIPGTTRDLVTETVSLGGIPVHLVDTAGIREAHDEAESIGIQKSREAMADADLVLVVIDAHQSSHDVDRQLISAASARSAIVVENKIDLGRHTTTNGVEIPVVHTSATTGEGIAELREQILRMVSGESGREESGFLTNLRQHQLVTDSLKALDSAENALQLKVPHEMVLMDLYNALRPLDDITGATTADDILNLIFSTFCIGK